MWMPGAARKLGLVGLAECLRENLRPVRAVGPGGAMVRELARHPRYTAWHDLGWMLRPPIDVGLGRTPPADGGASLLAGSGPGATKGDGDKGGNPPGILKPPPPQPVDPLDPYVLCTGCQTGGGDAAPGPGTPPGAPP